MITATPQINLLPLDEIEKAPLGKFLKWALTYGRYIVVLTELVVLAAFLSRFKLDRDMNDLSGEVERKKRIVQSAAAFEDKVRTLQTRINEASMLELKAGKPEEILSMLTTIMPSEVRLLDVSINTRKVTINGLTATEGGISSFTDSLRKEKIIKTVSVEKIEKNQNDGLLRFSLTVELWL